MGKTVVCCNPFKKLGHSRTSGKNKISDPEKLVLQNHRPDFLVLDESRLCIACKKDVANLERILTSPPPAPSPSSPLQSFVPPKRRPLDLFAPTGKRTRAVAQPSEGIVLPTATALDARPVDPEDFQSPEETAWEHMQ
ncbi:unnamed protein product, partial [Allacma fusca]